MTITIEQAADLVISGPGTVRDKIIAGIEAYAESGEAAGEVREYSNGYTNFPEPYFFKGIPKVGTKLYIAPPTTPDKVAELQALLDHQSREHQITFDHYVKCQVKVAVLVEALMGLLHHSEAYLEESEEILSDTYFEPNGALSNSHAELAIIQFAKARAALASVQGGE